MKVPWIAGRKVALARALAISLAEHDGMNWLRDFTQAQRDARLSVAKTRVDEWIGNGVLAAFEYEYREKDKD